jgi:hypothetical protein
MTEPTDPPVAGVALAAEVHHHLLWQIAHVPHHLMVKAREQGRAAYTKLEHRYGPHYARAILAAGLAGLPVPVPFSTALTAAPVLAVAEIHRDLSRAGGLKGLAHVVVLPVEEIAARGKHFMNELLHGAEAEPAPESKEPEQGKA